MGINLYRISLSYFSLLVPRIKFIKLLKDDDKSSLYRDI